MSELVGKVIGVNFRTVDSTGENLGVQRTHGIIEEAKTDGLVVRLGGVRDGELLTVPIDVRKINLDGVFHFPESDEWVHIDYFYEVQVRREN